MKPLPVLIGIILFLAVPILIGGVARKIRARAQNRRGPSLLQDLYDITRLMRRRPVDGANSGFFAEVAPIVAMASCIMAAFIACFDVLPVVLLPLFLAAEMLAIVTFAAETGTSFGGMAASRFMLLTVFSKPILILALLLSEGSFPFGTHPSAMVIDVVFLITLLVATFAELAKPPFDDPRTHLELTMVHEAMLLEASGFRLGCFEIAARFKATALIVFAGKFFLLRTVALTGLDEGGLAFAIWWIVLVATLIFVAGFWEAISVRRRWSSVPEVLGVTLSVVILLVFLLKMHGAI